MNRARNNNAMVAVSRHRQSGAGLLLLLLVIIVAAASVLASQLSEATLKSQQKRVTQAALAKAKRALLDFASTYPDRFAGQAAQLPCPDIDGGAGLLEGESHTAACGAAGVSVLGRVPWRTLGISAVRDASGFCLWYAVSGTYKSAAAETASMINPDSNGQLQVFSVETGAFIEGTLAEDRPVAILLAPQQALPGQTRAGIGSANLECSSDFSSAGFLDAASGLGISNASLSGSPDAVETFAVSASFDAQHNDSLLTISRAELAAAVYQRHDFETAFMSLTRGIASCIAAYGLQNPGGSGDRRLPWPAPVQLSNYSLDSAYDDADTGIFSGRVPDRVDDSNSVTGNALSRVLSDCSVAAAPDWNPAYLPLWRNWKDHFFYAVAESYEPGATVPSACSSCLTINGAGAYTGIVLFAGERLSALGQRRNAPPTDSDTKQQVINYLEGNNATNHPYTGGVADYASQPVGAVFNDVAFCIDAAMTVAAC